MRRIGALLLALLLLLSGCARTGDVVVEENAVPSPESSSQPAPVPVFTPAPLPSIAPEPEPDTRHWSEKEIALPAPLLDGNSSPEGMVPLKELPADYSTEDALADGCIVSKYDESGNYISYSSREYDAFLESAVSGQKGIVRCIKSRAVYYGMSNTPTVSQYAYDLEYDGASFVLRKYLTDSKSKESYEFVSVYSFVNAWQRENEALVCGYSSVEAAVEDGCVVIAGMNNTQMIGEDKWQAFLIAVENKTPARVRIADTFGHDPTSMEDEIYSVIQVDFDGENFVFIEYDEVRDTIVSSIYSYLHVYENERRHSITYTLLGTHANNSAEAPYGVDVPGNQVFYIRYDLEEGQ